MIVSWAYEMILISKHIVYIYKQNTSTYLFRLTRCNIDLPDGILNIRNQIIYH